MDDEKMIKNVGIIMGGLFGMWLTYTVNNGPEANRNNPAWVILHDGMFYFPFLTVIVLVGQSNSVPKN